MHSFTYIHTDLPFFSYQCLKFSITSCKVVQHVGRDQVHSYVIHTNILMSSPFTVFKMFHIYYCKTNCYDNH